ncbi:MAG TPA: exopolyphosphatase [Xanthomonadaceae bacterium]|nr:exopolyphosphatase [Xanthomonadaceae bacterium]HRY00804.1 exopolyphosphatase [Xanthomonadaceae bacterium]
MGGTDSQLQDGELLAAIDIGSNSFHMVVARHSRGQLRVVDRIREPVRMAAGLDARGGLSAEARQRASDCLARFGQRIASLPPERVRAIATNTVRKLRNPQAFLVPAETALGHSIEVVSGREEARLIYLGVAQGHPPGNRKRLVIDIGGGSTEFIIGQGYEPLKRESLQVGCVETTRRFFADGRITRERWEQALTEIGAEFQQFAQSYAEIGWEQALGSSGTIKAIAQIAAGRKGSSAPITREILDRIVQRLVDIGRVDKIKMPGLVSERQPVIAGGVLVLDAAFRALGLQRIEAARTAMREGVLYDMLGRARHTDPRDSSVDALADRYGADRAQGRRVEATALQLFDQVDDAWKLGSEDRQRLGWASRLLEIGLSIAHSQHHQHGAYLVEYSDIAGFSRQEQIYLSVLVRCQRRSLPLSLLEAQPERIRASQQRLIALLRIAALLHRSHDASPLPPVVASVADHRLRLAFAQGYLAAHPLTLHDLETEADYLAAIGLRLEVEAS